MKAPERPRAPPAGPFPGSSTKRRLSTRLNSGRSCVLATGVDVLASTKGPTLRAASLHTLQDCSWSLVRLSRRAAHPLLYTRRTSAGGRLARDASRAPVYFSDKFICMANAKNGHTGARAGHGSRPPRRASAWSPEPPCAMGRSARGGGPQGGGVLKGGGLLRGGVPSAPWGREATRGTGGQAQAPSRARPYRRQHGTIWGGSLGGSRVGSRPPRCMVVPPSTPATGPSRSRSLWGGVGGAQPQGSHAGGPAWP